MTRLFAPEPGAQRALFSVSCRDPKYPARETQIAEHEREAKTIRIRLGDD